MSLSSITKTTRSPIHDDPWWIAKNRNRIQEKSYPDGAHYWYLNGRLHREDGPALISSSGKKYWYLHGKRYEPVEWMFKLHELGPK